MIMVKVRFTGKQEEIDRIIWKISFSYVVDNGIVSLRNVSAFYPNRGKTDVGRVYADLVLTEDEDAKEE